MKQRDNFPTPILNLVPRRTSFICSNPDCRASTLSASLVDDKFTYLGVVAHIEAASPGGPHYNPNMNTETRKSESNAIFLCSSCATMIDKNNGKDYSVCELKKWKQTHDVFTRDNLNKKISTQKQNSSTQTFNIKSIHQSGGITAGIVNIAPQSRKLEEPIISTLLQSLNKKKDVIIISVFGDNESFTFSIKIKEMLIKNGFMFNQPSRQSVFKRPITGLKINISKNTITVGSKEY